MNGKMIMGIALIVGIVSVVFLAAPIQAYFDGTGNGDLLQTQQRDKLRAQNCDCPSDCAHTQCRETQRSNECSTNRICNCTMKLEQHRCKNRERTRSLGH